MSCFDANAQSGLADLRKRVALLEDKMAAITFAIQAWGNYSDRRVKDGLLVQLRETLDD